MSAERGGPSGGGTTLPRRNFSEGRVTMARPGVSGRGEGGSRSFSISSRISSPRMATSKAGLRGLPEFRPSAPNPDRQTKSFSFQNSRPFTVEPLSNPAKSPSHNGPQLERSSFREESKPATKVSLQKRTGENIARSIISEKNTRTYKTEQLTSIDRKIKTRQFSTTTDGLPITDQNRLSIERVKIEIPHTINLGRKDMTTYRRPIERPIRATEKLPEDSQDLRRKILFDTIPRNETKPDRDLNKQIQKLVRSKGLEKTQQILQAQGENASITTIFRLAINDQAQAQKQKVEQQTLVSGIKTTTRSEAVTLFQRNSVSSSELAQRLRVTRQISQLKEDKVEKKSQDNNDTQEKLTYVVDKKAEGKRESMAANIASLIFFKKYLSNKITNYSLSGQEIARNLPDVAPTSAMSGIAKLHNKGNDGSYVEWRAQIARAGEALSLAEAWSKINELNKELPPVDLGRNGSMGVTKKDVERVLFGKGKETK